MTKPTKIFSKVDVFPIEILAWIGAWDDKGVHRFISKNGYAGEVEPPGHKEGGCCWDLGCGGLIWMPHFPKTPVEYGFLAHEAVHAASNFGEHLGFKLSPKSEEFYTYLVGYIVEKILDRKPKIR
jgi:hypothetical protein